MNTVVARTLYRLFAENLFVTAITFDAGSNVIAYPWGEPEHEIFVEGVARSGEAPDFVAFDAVGRALVSAAGGNITVYSQE